MDHIQIFTTIYETCHWTTNNNSHYKGSSGQGSSIDYNKDTYVPFLKQFIKDKTIQSVVDFGCGDFRVGPLIYDDLDVTYTGYDAYGKVIEYHQKTIQNPKYTFIHLDFLHAKLALVPADMCILKDVLQHWKLDEIYEFLDYLVASNKYKYILICNCSFQERDLIQNTDRFTPLSTKFLPLKKYTPVVLYTWETKEVSLITC